MKSFILQTSHSFDDDHRLLISYVTEIANHNTRVAYHQACRRFLDFVFSFGLRCHEVRTPHVAAWRELLMRRHAIATVKLYLAAVRGFYDWLAVRHHCEVNPALSVKSPRESLTVGKTSFLEPEQARKLLLSIDRSGILGLRDRALIGTMLYTFARIGAVLSLRCRDVVKRNDSTWLLLREKGGKVHEMPLHPDAEIWVREYLGLASLGQTAERRLFRSFNRQTRWLSDRPLLSVNAYAMVKRRALAAGINMPVCNHTFRATGITAFLANGGTLEHAAKLANHASTRTTQLYDRRLTDLKVAEIQRISF